MNIVSAKRRVAYHERLAQYYGELANCTRNPYWQDNYRTWALNHQRDADHYRSMVERAQS